MAVAMSQRVGGDKQTARALKLRQLVWAVVCLLEAGCSRPPTESKTPSPVALGEPVSFVFLAQGGAEVSSESLRGRATLVALVTTYDWASQLVLRRVNQALGSYAPRINALAIVLEPPSYGVLVEAFSRSLGLHFPVVMADQASLEGAGPLGPIDYVPTLVVLDEEGRVVERLRGLLSAEQIYAALDHATGAHHQTAPAEVP